VEINRELSENQLFLLNLKNEKARLTSIFDVRVEETERNFKLDVAKFEEEIQRMFKNHTNLTKILERKVDEIKFSQEELAFSLSQIEERVQGMQEALG
jgi:ParB-like chromosome segregation protein Spo0J